MKTLAPTSKVDLDHRAWHFVGAPIQSLIIAAAEHGHLSVVGPGPAVLMQMDRPEPLRAQHVHPTQPWIALAEGKEGRLAVVGLDDGDHLHESKAPALHKHSLEWVKAGIAACYFDPSGQYLWTAAPLSHMEVLVELRECSTWKVIGSVVAADDNGGSEIDIEPSGQPGTAFLTLTTGQEGQLVYWLEAAPERVGCRLEDGLEDAVYPVVAPSGSEMLALTDEMTLSRFSVPDVALLGQCRWPGWDDMEGHEDGFGFSTAYLNDTLALVNSSQGRLFFLDVPAMQLAGEVAVEGHEPVPASTLYGAAFGDQLCTDLHHFYRHGDNLVFVFHREGVGGDSRALKDTLLFVPVEDVVSALG
ncbi:MAG: hypothetical protein ACLQVD_13225 [Capsulimonadaceae bacterium]